MKNIGEIIDGRELITVPDEMTILEAAQLMTAKQIGAVPVTDEKGKVVGIFTERDLMMRVVAAELDTKTTLIKDVMTKEKLLSATHDMAPNHCLKKMKERKCRHLLIVDKKKVIGIVSQRDLIELDLKVKTRALLSIDA